jgi:hypothetical protein
LSRAKVARRMRPSERGHRCHFREPRTVIRGAGLTGNPESLPQADVAYGFPIGRLAAVGNDIASDEAGLV